MKGKAEPRKAELREYLSVVLPGCPVDKGNSEDCPLHELRAMPPKLQTKWLFALDEDALANLASYHHICMKTKLALKQSHAFDDLLVATIS